MVFRRINPTFTFSFSFPTSKSESCVGSWTPLRRRWRLWHLSWLPTWVYLLQKVPSKQPEHLHDNLLSESFYGKSCLSKEEYKSLNPLLCVWSPHVCICFCLFVGLCLFSCLWLELFLACARVSRTASMSLCFCLSWWVFSKEPLPNSIKQREQNRDRWLKKENTEMRISESRHKCVMRGWNRVRCRDLQPKDKVVVEI